MYPMSGSERPTLKGRPPRTRMCWSRDGRAAGTRNRFPPRMGGVVHRAPNPALSGLFRRFRWRETFAAGSRLGSDRETAMARTYPTFTCSYRFEGREQVVHIVARDAAEVSRRLRAIGTTAS